MAKSKRRRFPTRDKQKRAKKREKISASSLLRLAPTIKRRLAAVLEPTGKYCYKIPKRHPAIIGVGGAQLVIDLGSVQLGKRKVSLVCKILQTPERSLDHHLLWETTWRRGMRVELTTEFLKHQGFPVAMHLAIPYKKTWVIVSENLQAGGKKMHEAFDFDFSRLKNGKELKKQLNEHIKRLFELRKNGFLQLDRHVKADSGAPFEGELRVFYIVEDPKISVGRLVVADLDHLTITSKPRRLFKDIFATIEEKFWR